MSIRTLGLLSIVTAAVFVASPSFADSLFVKADIPFAFQVKGTTLPAGHYEFTEEDNGNAIRIVGRVKGEDVIVSTVTRLASEMHAHAADAHLVFDVVDGVHTLSEVWESGTDGFLVHATKGLHTHRVVTTPKSST